MRAIICAALMVRVGAGCHDNSLFRQDDAQGANQRPNAYVDPPFLDFGGLGPRETKQLSFAIGNNGDKNSVLNLRDVNLSLPSGFTFVDESGEFVADFDEHDLPAGKELTAYVQFAPTAPLLYEAEARVHSNDEQEPVLPVTLTGLGLIPQLALNPEFHNFGEITVGCAEEKDLTLMNVGNALLTVDDLGSDTEGLEIVDMPLPPFSLEPGESVDIMVEFLPNEERAYRNDIVATSDDPGGERKATLEGIGHVPAAHNDLFEIPENPPVDILFFIDQSPSMRDDQAALADNFEHFIWNMDDVTDDWRIIVIVRDNGCTNADVITSDMPDYLAAFTDAVTAEDDGGDIYTEGGLIVARNALEMTDRGECNDGFLRRDALLHIIMVADEPDQSPSSWDVYLADIVDKKNDPYLVKFSAVAGDYPWGCISDTNSAEPGTGYYEAVQATHGEYLSLCSSWSRSAADLADASVIRSMFPLTRRPDPASIQVWVNGEVVRGGWDFVVETNMVVFQAGKEPGEGDIVDIRYHDPFTCDVE